MRSNAWIIIEKLRALSWRAWLRWRNDPESGDEPPLSEWEQKAASALHDQEYIFRGFLRPEILGKVWIMLSVYDVTAAQIATGYANLGDAESGGDFACAGFWTWEAGDQSCVFVALYPWRAGQIVGFMPPTYDENGDEVPAVGVRDVNVLFGQPPRVFPG